MAFRDGTGATAIETGAAGGIISGNINSLSVIV
jgi:hypothetical protein